MSPWVVLLVPTFALCCLVAAVGLMWWFGRK